MLWHCFFVGHAKSPSSLVNISVTSSGSVPDGYLTNSIKACAANSVGCSRDSKCPHMHAFQSGGKPHALQTLARVYTRKGDFLTERWLRGRVGHLERAWNWISKINL